MNWKFWQKKQAEPTGVSGKKESKPKDLPQAIGRRLVVDLGLDPDWAWSLKIVTREKENEKGTFEFRIFDPAAASVKVTGFSSLETHPELVLYNGCCEKNGTLIEFKDCRITGTAA